MNKQHIVQLSKREHQYLESIIHKGKHTSREVVRAHILLKSHAGATEQEIVSAIGTSRSTVQRTRLHYATVGLERAMTEKSRSGAPPKLTDRAEAYLVAIACSAPPSGAAHWSLELLREKLITAREIKQISTVAIWNHLNDRGIKPWREKNVGDPNPHPRLH